MSKKFFFLLLGGIVIALGVSMWFYSPKTPFFDSSVQLDKSKRETLEKLESVKTTYRSVEYYADYNDREKVLRDFPSYYYHYRDSDFEVRISPAAVNRSGYLFEEALILVANSSTKGFEQIGDFGTSEGGSYSVYVHDNDIIFNWTSANYDGCCSKGYNFGILIYDSSSQKKDSKDIFYSNHWGPEEAEPDNKQEVWIFVRNGELILESINVTSTFSGDVYPHYLLKNGAIQQIR